jgi:peroxiredoxin
MLSLISSSFWHTALILAILLSPATLSWAEDSHQGFPVSRAGQELIGTPAKQWFLDGWLDGTESTQPTLENLRGQVVLIRFWTATCPYCAASLPALSTLAAQKREQGLVVLGLHHPKPFGTTTSAMTLQKVLKDWQVDIPVGQDSRWQTLKTYWLDERPRTATSVTFLIDRKGIIRWIHPGVEYHPDDKQPGHEQCVSDWQDLVQAVTLLLQEGS